MVLKGLVDRISGRRGRKHPVTSIRRIALHASPLHGAAVANVVGFGLQLNRWSRLFRRFWPYGQLAHFRRGQFCDQLIRDVVNLIYRPAADDPSHPGADSGQSVRGKARPIRVPRVCSQSV